MKRIILTESQYNRLVRKPLNETTIYENPEDSEKLTKDMLDTLIWVSGGLWGDYKKDLYVKKIEGNEIHINQSKYNEEEKRSIIFWYKKIFSDSDNIDEEKLIMYIGEDEPEVVIDEPEVVIDVDKDTSFVIPIPNNNITQIGRNKFLKSSPNEKVDVRYVFDFFIRKGLKDYQACGILGNMYKESMFNTGIVGDSRTSLGMAQWHKGRLQKLSNFSKIKGKPITDKDLQLDFLWNELNGKYSSVLNKINNSRNIKDVSFQWACKYEVCENCCIKESQKNKDRLKKGKEYLETYGNKNSNSEIGGGKYNSYELYTPISTGNYFRKKNNKLYNSKGHSGHDYVAKNKKIVFMKGGKVDIAKFNNDSCGGTITIYVDNGNRKSIFCHLSEIYVNNGEEITPGTVIGVSGGGRNQKGAGHSTGHHLHYGMKKNNEFVDPLPFIDEFKLVKK